MEPLNIDGPDAFARAFGVSRETLERLEIYAGLLLRWQKAVNLISPKTLKDIWQRHFADSAQVLAFAPDARVWLDLGSGGGFPGVVIAMMLANHHDRKVHLVESNGRKCAFLHEVARHTHAPVRVHEGRAGEIAEAGVTGRVDVVTARALAPLDELLGLASPFFSASTKGVFLKGRDWRKEIGDAEKSWRFRWKASPSRTDKLGQILEIADLAPLKKVTGSG